MRILIIKDFKFTTSTFIILAVLHWVFGQTLEEMGVGRMRIPLFYFLGLAAILLAFVIDYFRKLKELNKKIDEQSKRIGKLKEIAQNGYSNLKHYAEYNCKEWKEVPESLDDVYNREIRKILSEGDDKNDTP